MMIFVAMKSWKAFGLYVRAGEERELSPLIPAAILCDVPVTNLAFGHAKKVIWSFTKPLGGA